MWGFGCLIWEVYNGPLARPEQLKIVEALPKPLLPQYVLLIRWGCRESGRNEVSRGNRDKEKDLLVGVGGKGG